MDKTITVPKHKITYTTTNGVIDYSITTTNTTYTFDMYTANSTKTATINWGSCTCGLDSCDGTHPGGVVSELELGANIYDAYGIAVPNGYAWNVTVNGVRYALVGWKNSATGEELAADAVVTPEMLDTTVNYTPIIESGVPLYSYTNTSGNTVIVFAEDGKTLAQIVADAQAGSTITLLGDVEIPDTASIAITKNLTINLNGHVLSDNKVVAAKYPTFSVGASLTFKGDKEGSMIVKAHNVQGKNGYLGHLCQPTASAGTINFKGENLRVFAPSLAASWGTTININIDGGYYARGNASDNDGWVYANASTATNISVKNAVFGDIHALLSVYAGNTKAHNFTADNCVFVGQVLKMLTAGFTNSTITNCYIASSATIGTASEGGSVQLGAGNWIESGAKIDLLTYENNISLFSASNSITIPVHKIQFANVDGAVTYSIETTEATYNFNNYTADSSKIATVTWYDTDGVTVLGTTEGIPGLAASAPLVPVADGWVNALYTEWTNANGEKTTIIPVDATEVSFTLVGGSAATYVVGKVPLWMNWSYLTHSCINVYVPENAPAGVVMTGAKLNGIDRINSFKGGFMVADTPVKRMQVWPELANVDDGIPAQITFTYAGETFTYNATADVAKYIGQVLDGNHREEQKQAIAAWAG